MLSLLGVFDFDGANIKKIIKSLIYPPELEFVNLINTTLS